MRYFVLLWLSLCSFSVTAGQWVDVDITDSVSGYQKTGVGESKVQQVRLTSIPHVKVRWLDENERVVEQGMVIDPRAIWPLLEDDAHGVGHEVVILRSQEQIKLHKPDGASALDIEYLNLDLSTSSRKLYF